MTDLDPIDEQSLEELLRDYSLSSNVSEELSEAIFAQEYNAPINKAKEQAMLNRLKKDPGGKGSNMRFLWGGIFVLLLLSTAAFFFFSGSKTPQTTTATNISDKQVTIVPENNRTAGKGAPIAADQSPVPKTDTFGRISRLYPAVYADSGVATTNPQPVINIITNTTTLPFLGETDKKRYASVKQQMLAKLYALDKGLYTHVLANKTDYAGKETVVDAFNIRNVAVTNLEYKTFLADLIVQNNQEAYYASEVLSLKWAQEGCTELAHSYFQDERYNDFPVVNVSPEGAKQFCRWLDAGLKTYIQQHKLKSKTLQVRLPYDKEWILAARDGYAKISYETGYNTIYEIREGLVDFSFVKRMHQIRKKAMSKDTLYDLYITNRYGWSEKAIQDFLAKGFGAFSPAPGDTLYPDRMKVFGKIGHVSEIVPQFGTSRNWLSGLTWKTKESYQAFEEKFKSAGASPFVSFRYVVVDAQDAEYKDPFW